MCAWPTKCVLTHCIVVFVNQILVDAGLLYRCGSVMAEIRMHPLSLSQMMHTKLYVLFGEFKDRGYIN